LDTELLLESAATAKLIVTLEDHVLAGGFGSAVLEALQASHVSCPVERIGWPDEFIGHGSSVQILREAHGLDTDGMLKRILECAEKFAVPCKVH
jgi:1-deoxy-D-xylulose-5-phosphate synthase